MFKRSLLGRLLVLAVAAPRAVEAQAADTVHVGTHHSPWAAGILELVEPSPNGGVSLGMRLGWSP